MLFRSMQIEGAALVQGSFEGDRARLRPIARQFLEFLLSPEVQTLIPLKNWMLPVIQGTQVPESFRRLPQARKLVKTTTQADQIERALKKWKQDL